MAAASGSVWPRRLNPAMGSLKGELMSYEFFESDARHLPFADKAADLCIASPPYLDARRYSHDDIARGCAEWASFMLEATVEALRVTRGLVLWVCAGVTRDNEYQPGPEGLVWAAYQKGLCVWRPCIWTKNGLPGSGGKQWLRNDWEYILAFKNPGPLPWAAPLATGQPPKYKRGGRMRNRGQDDQRVDRDYPVPKLANPGNVIHVTVGGRHLGHPLAHENEAPFPELLVEFFIRSFCPPNGVVLDPFCGSGTTIAVARKLGRQGLGVDIRPPLPRSWG
jgi:site-specific DNA-methyltransferase (adenine-specific)/site-specific DNA-methyltransferase (cytosine-N4-specific)